MQTLMHASIRRLVVGLLVAAAGLAAGIAAAQDARHGNCITCHAGIEPIADYGVKKRMACVKCHLGNADATTEAEAHKGMYANPSDLRVIDRTCGTCHEEEVENAKKSLHATMAGVISGTRYANGAQAPKNAIYATYAVKSDKEPSAPGAVKSLEQIPSYDPAKPTGPTNHPMDDYLREQCLRCHIWSGGGKSAGDVRASGCASCHVVYSNSGLYEGGDKAIDRKKVGRPKAHRIVRAAPTEQCQHCHNRGGRTGMSYSGMMESDGYGSPWGAEAGKKGGIQLHGKNYNHLTPDLHAKAGLACVDCHTTAELHGDGNIYSKREQATEVRCETCHGTLAQESNLKTSRGNPMTNLRRAGGKVVLTTKVDALEKVVPQARDAMRTGSAAAKAAKGIAAHGEKLECYACHAQWAPQCYGCHVQQDTTKKSGDWINTVIGADPSKGGNAESRLKTAAPWSETRSYLRWESPVLGINSRGRVSPFIPGCQVIFTQIGADGKATERNKVFTTADGMSGLAHAPIQPHTISKASRSCEDCHANRKTLGLGSGFYDTKANGVDVPFELERIVDEKGRQIQAVSHEGARPFNQAEQERILRVNVCMSCHGGVEDAIWKKVTDAYGFAKNDAQHRAILRNLMKGAAGAGR